MVKNDLRMVVEWLSWLLWFSIKIFYGYKGYVTITVYDINNHKSYYQLKQITGVLAGYVLVLQQ